MTDPLEAQALEMIGLAENATQGKSWISGASIYVEVPDGDSLCIADCDMDTRIDHDTEGAANARFFNHARENAPAIARAYLEARAEIERLREAVLEARDFVQRDKDGLIESGCPHDEDGNAILEQLDDLHAEAIREEHDPLLAKIDAALHPQPDTSEVK